MKRILLVNPHDTAQSGFSNPPLGLLYLAGTLRVHGFEVHLVDGCLKGKGAIDEALERLQPDAVGISCLTPGRHRALEIAAQAKKQNPKTLTVLGGAHPTIMYRQILNHYPFVDAIVRGEGEHAFSELLQEKPMTAIKGLAYRQKGRILDTGLSVPVDNLDDLPMPAWDLVDLQRYPAIDRGTYHGIDLAAVPRISVIYSRGCSGRCHFCSSWWIWKGWRCRSAPNMVDEIEWLYREQQIRHFCFADDALTVDRQATLALCDEIVRRDLRIVFHATTRSDCVDAEMLQGLKAAGCYKIAVGVETASQRLLNRMGKDNEVEYAERAIRLSKEAGLLTTALMIVGNVGETEATIAESLAFLRRCQPDDIGTVGGLWILPGTRLHADCKRSGYIDDEFWLSDAPYKIYTREHSPERLTNFKKRLMTYKNDAKGHPMSDPTHRHQSGDSFLAKWNRYVDSTVNEYSATSRWQGVDALHRELFQKIPADGSAVLDLGCGDGWSTNELIKMGKAAVGVTINPTEVRHARETYGIELHLQDMHDLQFPDGHFDGIYCRESFEHCVAPYIALCEMNRVLKPGGYALINLPDAVWIREDSHFSVLSPPQMHEMCYKCRFEIVRSGRTEPGHYWYLARKVAEIDEPCPYPAPDPLAFQPAVDSSTENDAPEVSEPRIIGMLRIKNEAAWIADVLTKAADLVDGFVILDDGSTDATPAICRAHPRVLRYEWQNERETDEVRDKNRLLRWTLEESPDWVLALDGDEVLEDAAVDTIRESVRAARPDVTKLGISFLYMWDSEDAYRIDGHYREVRHPRLFRVTGLPMAPEALTYSPSRYGSNFHCGSVPTNLPGETHFLDVRVKHYGYFEARQRQAKKAFYATRDPENASAGYYDHLTATDGIRLRAYRERSTTEVLRPDGSPDDALQTLKRAGNPLWQSALFYAPDCQNHLDIGTNLGHTLKGLDPERITAIEAYGPAARELEHLYGRVIQGDARDIVPALAARGEFFDRITLFDVIEHLTRDEGETLLDHLEAMALQEIVLFVPLETPALVESPAYRAFMQRQFARIPADQHELQQHRAHWSPEDFERRGYIVTLIEDFHMPGFHAFFACKYCLKTTTELMQQRIAGYLANARFPGTVPADTPMPQATASDATAPVFGGIGAHSKVHAPSLVTHPEHIFIGERVMVRQGARLEAITDYRGQVYEPELRIDDGTQIELDAHIGAARSVRIGKKVMIAGRVTILDHDHGYRNPLQPPIDQPLDIAPVVIEDGAWLGENAVICKGVTIGRHAVVGANSVVTRNVPPWGVVAGAPARLIKYYNHGTETWVESATKDGLKASIVIPVHNHCDYTRACIEAIVEETPEGVYEIIVVDNASSDATRELLDRHADRVLTIRNNTNRGFVEACNQGAAAARAPYIVFLNNDTLPQIGWLEALIEAIEHHDKVGAVGAKLIYPDGRLQEAGGVVFSDGRSKNFGRGDDPDKPEYNRICEVDYCSGACLMVRRDLFESLGGFDMRYAPAYYEETDLCFGLRDHGYRILYAPACRVYHYGSVTADSNPQESLRNYIDINRTKFIQKWSHVLVDHEAPLEGRDRLYTSDRRLIGSRTLPDSARLALDESGPDQDMETFARQVHAQVQEWVAAGRHAEALSRLETLTRLRPDDAMAHNDLGALYYARADKDLAERCYHRAVELAPENLTFRKNLADFLFVEKGWVAESLSHYHYILEKHPRDLETLIAIGHVCARCDQPDDAAAFFNQALAVDPDNAEVRHYLKSLHPPADNPNAATEPDPEGTDDEPAQRLVSQERISEAIAALERQVAAYPDDALAHNDLGVLYYQTDRKDLSLQCYERAIALAPQNLTFQKNLADFQCIELGQYAEAKQIYLKILKDNPGDDECRQALAFIADKEGLSRVNAETRPPAVPAVVTTPRHQSNKHQSGGRFGAERIVVLSNHQPWFDRGSSDLRIHHLLKIMIAQGADILFLYPGKDDDDPSYGQVYGNGVEFRRIPYDPTAYCDAINAFKATRVWLTNLWHRRYIRFAVRLGDAVKQTTNAQLIVDTMDFHYKKCRRQNDCFPAKADRNDCEELLDLETRLYRRADLIVTVTDTEREDILNAIDKTAPIAVIPNIHPIEDPGLPGVDRPHLCFLGNFNVSHNRDAAHFFIDEVYPRIRAHHPQAEFHIIGHASANYRSEFESVGVKVIGAVDCLQEVLSGYRVFVCPMQYGAGLKGKLGVAASLGLPIVTTPIGAEGFPFRDGVHCFIADDPSQMADRCRQLLSDQDLCARIGDAARKSIREHFSPAAVEAQLAELFSTAKSRQTKAAGDETQMRHLAHRLAEVGWSDRQALYERFFDALTLSPNHTPPALSIIVISWRYLKDTLENFRRLERQRHQNFEIVFVDNGGQPGEFDALKPYIDTYVRLNQNTGAYLARNVGAAFARAPHLFFLEDDGLVEENCVAAHLACFARYDVVAVCGVCRPKSKNNPYNAMARHYYFGPRAFPRYASLEGNVSYHAATFFAAGGWDDTIRFGGGGAVLARRIQQVEPDLTRQIYSPDPIIYHDYATNDEHLRSKRDRQMLSLDRIKSNDPGFEDFMGQWEKYYLRNEMVPLRHGEPGPDPSQETDPSEHADGDPMPLVSIVIPTYNRADLLKSSIQSALDQDYTHLEIIVVDDASTDHTADVLRSFSDPRIRYIHKEHSGAPLTRNRGISEARGGYIVWLDDDDLLLPDAVSRHLDVLCQFPDSDVVYGIIDQFDNASGESMQRVDLNDWSINPEMLLSAMISGCPIPNGGTMIRREAYQQIGLYAPEFDRAHDFEFWSRAAGRLSFRKTYAVVCRYRVHQGNMSVGDFIDRSYESLIVRRMVARYGVQTIFPWLDWNEPDKADVVASYIIAKSLLDLGDIRNSQLFLNRIPIELQTPETSELMLRCIMYGRDEDASRQYLELLSAKASIDDSHLEALRKTAATYFRLITKLQTTDQSIDHDAIRSLFQEIDRHAFHLPGRLNLRLATWFFQNHQGQLGLSMLKNAILQNPTDKSVIKKAMSMFATAAEGESLKAIIRRIVQPVNASKQESGQKPIVLPASATDVRSGSTDGIDPVAATFILPFNGRVSRLTQLASDLSPSPEVGCEILVLSRKNARTYHRASKALESQNIRLKVMPCRGRKAPSPADYNTAIKSAKNQWVVLMRDTLYLDSRWLPVSNIVRHQDDRCGVLSPVIPGASGPLAAPADLPADTFDQRALALANRFRHRRLPQIALASPCLIVPREWLHHLGGLDMACHDASAAFADFTVRAFNGGGHNYVLGDVLAEYYRSARSKNDHASDPIAPICQVITTPDANNAAGQENDPVALMMKVDAIDRAFQRDCLEEAMMLIGQLRPEMHNVGPLSTHIAGQLLANGQPQAALEVLGEPDGFQPSFSIMAVFARAMEQSGDHAQAEKWTQRLLNLNPSHADGLDLSGVLAYRRGDRALAETLFRKAIAADPSAHAAYAHLATLLWENGEQTDALEHFKQAFVIRPDHPAAARDFHAAATACEVTDEACHIFTDACRLFPQNRRLHHLLTDLLIRREQHAQALLVVESMLARFGFEDGLLEASIAIRNQAGPMDIAVANQEKSVSLCMIARNEERYLAKCLHSLKPLVDEIILVDTGSTDATPKIAAIFGARVFDFKWCDDFAAARNYAIDQAKGQWILVMDADEVISPRDYGTFRSVLHQDRTNATAFSIVTRNYTHQCNLIGWQANDGKYPQEEVGMGWTPSEKVRLFPNDHRLRFEYPVHEVVRPALERHGIGVQPFPVPVHHYGYLDHAKASAKGSAYYDIGIRKLQKMAHDPLALRELAVQAELLGHHQEAVNLWHKLLAIEPDNARAYVNLSTAYGQLGHFRDARDAAQKAMERNNDLKEAHFNAALAELYLGRASEAAGLLKPLVLKYRRYYAAEFMLGCARICCDETTEGLAAISRLESTPLWKTIRISIEEIAEGLAKAGRQNDAERIRSAVDRLDLPGPPFSRSPDPEQTASCATGL